MKILCAVLGHDYRVYTPRDSLFDRRKCTRCGHEQVYVLGRFYELDYALVMDIVEYWDGTHTEDIRLRERLGKAEGRKEAEQ